MHIEPRNRSNGSLVGDFYRLLIDTRRVFTLGAVNLLGWDYLNYHVDCALAYPARGKPGFWKPTIELGANGFEAWLFGRYFLVCRLDRMFSRKDEA